MEGEIHGDNHAACGSRGEEINDWNKQDESDMTLVARQDDSG